MVQISVSHAFVLPIIAIRTVTVAITYVVCSSVYPGASQNPSRDENLYAPEFITTDFEAREPKYD
jgi:hypothetical protein